MFNKTKTEPAKTDNQNANQPAQSPSPSPSASPLPTLSPTATPTPKVTPVPIITLSPNQISSVAEQSFSFLSVGMLSVYFVSVLVVLGTLWKCGCCCFGDKKSGKPSIPKKIED